MKECEVALAINLILLPPGFAENCTPLDMDVFFMMKSVIDQEAGCRPPLLWRAANWTERKHKSN
jgi:hypothetical protein